MEQPYTNFGTTNDSEFRSWIMNQWFEYKEEVFVWEKRVVTGNPQEYFQKYKWFLKQKYKQEKSYE